MPNRDPLVTNANARKTGKDQGKLVVRYRDVGGYTCNGKVLGAGSVSGLQLLLHSGAGRQIVDNVPLATGLKQTNVYFNTQV